MGRHSVFVFVVDFDSEELLDLLGRPHFNGIPGHPLANMDANFASDALIESNLHIRNDDIDTVRSIAGSVLDAVDWTETDTGLAARAVIRNDDSNLLGFLFLPRDLGRGFGNDQSRICFFRILCHTSQL